MTQAHHPTNRNSNTVYWSSTLLLSAFMAALSVAYFVLPFFAEAFEHMGFPQHFRVQLGIAKALGAVLLVAKVPERLKSFTYDGFAIMFICGILAHLGAGDPPSKAAGGLVALVLLAVSYFTRGRRLLTQ